MASIQVLEASAAITVDGTAAGYVTVADNTPFKLNAICNLYRAGSQASGTVTFATPVAGSNVTIGATTFVGTVGAVTPGDATYSVDTSNDAAATSLAAQIAAHAVASTVVTAVALGAVVTITAIDFGLGGNAIILTSTGPTAAVSGAGTLTSGSTVGTSYRVQIADIGAGNTIGLRFLPDPPSGTDFIWNKPLTAPNYGQTSCATILVAENWTLYQLEQIAAAPRLTA